MAKRPLDGIRVTDLTTMWAGPYATELLADYGAEVIKVESPAAWDNLRTLFPPPQTRGEEWWNNCAYFHEFNRNKKSLTLDLTSDRGKELFARLISKSDVVIENFRADVMDKLGFSFDWLRQQREDIIVVAMAGFGKTGPEAASLGYGPIIEQMSGLISLTGYGDGIPYKTGISYGDPIAGVAAAGAAVTALIQRQRTGRGQYIDLGQREVMTTMIGEAFMDWSMNKRLQPHWGNGHDWMAPHNAYPCQGEDNWIAIAVRTDADWGGLQGAMGNPDWAQLGDYADQMGRWEHRDALDEKITAWTATLTKEGAFDLCRRYRVPAGPVWKMLDLINDEQLNARGFFEPTHDAEHDSWLIHGWIWRWTDSGPCVVAPAPDFGQHNEEILTGLLDVPAADLPALTEQRIIASAPIDPPIAPVF